MHTLNPANRSFHPRALELLPKSSRWWDRVATLALSAGSCEDKGCREEREAESRGVRLRVAGKPVLGETLVLGAPLESDGTVPVLVSLHFSWESLVSCPDGSCSPYLPTVAPAPTSVALLRLELCHRRRDLTWPDPPVLQSVPRHLHIKALTPSSTDVDCVWRHGL